MANEISNALRELADRVDNEIPDSKALVIAIGDEIGIKLCGYYGSIEPAHDIAIHMFANGILEMNNRRAIEMECRNHSENESSDKNFQS